jgi:CheY-like chemotaxis protein/predicted phosphodiesterase
MSKKIIVIDDDATEADAVENLLNQWGSDRKVIYCSVPKLQNKNESSLEKYTKQAIDFVRNELNNNPEEIEAIFLDVLFQTTEDNNEGQPLGYRIGKELRRNFNKTPIILFTVQDELEQIKDAPFFFNFDGYITKLDFRLWKSSKELDSAIYRAKTKREEAIKECVEFSTEIISQLNPVILHISDIHRGFSDEEDNNQLYKSTFKSLRRDIESYSAEGIPKPNLIVVSGDITGKGSINGYKIASKFLEEISSCLDITNEKVIICPGNHDISRGISKLSYLIDPELKSIEENSSPNELYILRFSAFKVFFDNFYQGKQVYHLKENNMFNIFDYSKIHNIVIVTFNSCEKIDHIKHNRNKAYISFETLEKLKQKLDLLDVADKTKIAVWHHPFLFENEGEQMFHNNFLNELSKIGFKAFLHGHSHQPYNSYQPNDTQLSRGILQLGAGTIGVPADGRPADVPRHYEILAFDNSKNRVTVYSRQRLGDSWAPCPSFKKSNNASKDF